MFDASTAIQVVCLAGEATDIIVQSQAQQLFTFVLHKLISEDKREEIEVLYMRMVIRPIESWQSKKTLLNLTKKNSGD